MGNLAERIKYVRELRKLSQTAFGERLNKSMRAVQSWESGVSEPPLKTLREISDEFDVSWLWLTTGYSSPDATIGSDDHYDLVNPSMASRLHEIRIELKKSLEEMAKILGTTTDKLLATEAGEESINEYWIVDLSKKFNISIEFILTGEGEMFQKNIPSSNGDDLLHAVIKSVYAEIRKQKLDINLEKKVKIILALYEVFSQNDDKDIIQIQDYLNKTIETHFRILAE